MGKAILAIDQGTTSSRALVFDTEGKQLGLGQQEFTQHFPNNGWVEHDADEIWATTLASCEAAMNAAKVQAEDILCIGITNQRETTQGKRQTGEAKVRKHWGHAIEGRTKKPAHKPNPGPLAGPGPTCW
ncbi:MAG: FGGY family carbohydrate kinase, partial [Pseudohongiellaceae bacterium]